MGCLVCQREAAEQRYSYSEQELKQYFTEERVLAGLFKVIETLFAVAIREETAPVWHPDVRFYRIANLQGDLVGQFYLDLYARDHKQGGAWQDDARSRRARRTGLATPVSFLTCNFSRAGGRQAGDVEARRSADAVPRIRPWAASHADTR